MTMQMIRLVLMLTMKTMTTSMTMTKMVDTAMAAVHLVKTDQVYNKL